MRNFKNPKKYLQTATSIIALLTLVGCNVQDSKPKAKGTDNIHTLPLEKQGIPLFLGTAPSLEATKWDSLSGVATSLTGNINPILLDSVKTPLQTEGKRIYLNLSSTLGYNAIVDKVRKVPGGFVSQGHIESLDDCTFILNTSEDAVSAVIRLGVYGTYQVELGKDGKHRVLKQNGFIPAESTPPIPILTDTLPSVVAPALKAGAIQAVTVVDIMMLYTAQALAAAGSVSAMNSRLDGAIEEANQAYTNSGINAQLRLVHRALITYTETNNISTDLGRLANPGDGFLDNAHTLRTTYGADVVTLVTETTGGAYAGLGYVMKPISPSFKPYAFNVVMRSYLTGYHVLAHEVGHNMGCMHDLENSNNTGAFPYSYGWRFTGNDGVLYRTVMAYQPGTGIPYFSNPKVIFKGMPTGKDNVANNVVSINSALATFAAFNSPVVAAKNDPPTIVLSLPGNNTSFGGPTNLVLHAAVTDDNGVDSVVFFSGSTKLAKDAAAPYKISFQANKGTLNLSAIAYDKGGLSTTSNSFEVQVGVSGLSAPWNDAFVGTNGMPGNASISGSSITLTTAGKDFSLTGDGGQFAFQSLTGDGKIIAKLTSMTNINANSRAGIMIRDTIASGGKMVFVGATPTGLTNVISRATLNASAAIKATSIRAVPGYLMLIKKSSIIGAFASENGSDWSLLTSFTMTLPSTIMIGLATTSSDTAKVITSVFDSVSVTSGPVNFPPQITAFTGPLLGITANSGENILLSATVSDLDGVKNIKRVHFYYEDALIITDTTSPYSASWTAVSGNGKLWCQVVDSAGASTNSVRLPISVNASGTLTLNPNKDASVQDGITTGAVNSGKTATVFVKTNATVGQNYQGFVSFPISSQSNISKATLRFYGKVSVAGQFAVGAYGVADTTWKESSIPGAIGITWNSKPEISASLIDTLSLSSIALNWTSIDVTQYVAAQKAAGAKFVCFGLKGMRNTTAMATLSSREIGAGKPELVLTP